METMIFLQFLVALSMSLAAVCFFVWGTLDGQFKDGESIKFAMLKRELADEEASAHE
ncbi:MAG: hypothetical protein ABI609_15980 [Acidobacteriota bacterium]